MAEHYVKNLGKPDEVIEFPLLKVRALSFEEHGMHTLKGLEGEWRLSRFVSEPERAPA